MSPQAAALTLLLLLLGPAVGCVVTPPSDDDDATTAPSAPVAVIAPATLAALVGDTVTWTGIDSAEAVSWRWDFGDGSGTEPLDSPETTHRYEAPGHYLVGLEVRGADGRPASATVRATISWPLASARATHAGAVDFDWDEDAALVLAPDFDAVAVVGRSERAVLRWYDTCEEPASLSHSRSGGNPNALLVACADVDLVQVWDTANHERVSQLTLPWGSRPQSVVAPSTGNSGWVALAGSGELWEILLPLNGAASIGRQFTLPPDPRGLAALGRRVLVSRLRSGDSEGEWTLLDTQTGQLSGHTLRKDPGPDSDTTSRGVPSLLQSITIAPDGRAAWFPSLQSNVDRGLVFDGLPLTHETANRAVLSSVALTDEEVVFAGLTALGDERTRKVFDDRDLATSVAFSPAGDLVYVGTLGMETVEVLDAYTLQAAGSILGLTGGVSGLAMSGDGVDLYAVSLVSRTLTMLAPTTAGLTLSATVDLTRPGVPDAWSDEERQGRLLFQRSADPRMTQDGYLSCASCHLDGDADGRTWDFTDRGEGLRNTISLRGKAGTGHGPIHWSANFDEVQDFENDIRGPQAGAGFLSDADWAESAATLGPPKAGRSEGLDALTAYIGTLTRFPRSPLRTPEGALTAQALQGEALFLDPALGCVSCHPAPDYTDSQWLAPGQPLLHDVGTLTPASGGRLGASLLGLDTPTLRGLHATAPYLHHGSATTVRDVLLVSAATGDPHGVPSLLDAAELDALVAFLLQIE